MSRHETTVSGFGTDGRTEALMIVTKQQAKEGYVERLPSGETVKRKFKVLADRRDGTYVVVNPHAPIQRETP